MTEIPFTLLTIHDYQSVIQLAAALNVGVTVFKNIRVPAIAMYEDAHKKMEEEILYYGRMAIEGNEDAFKRGEKISEQRKKMLRAFEIHGDMALSKARRLSEKIKKREKEWSRMDNSYLSIPIFLSVVSIALLFVSVGSSATILIDEADLEKYQAVNTAVRFANNMGLGSLFVPFFMSVLNGIYARIYLWWQRGRLEKTLDRLASNLLRA